MAKALELAVQGRGRVSPNPMVGAVLVKSGRIVGRGYHREYGGAHAEVEALKEAGGRARGATMYVTMEPCCFHGKTPACTDAIARAGVAEVVAATLDPHEKVHGKGMRCLRRAGIRASTGTMSARARELNEAYFTFHRLGRPFVTLKLAATLDGMVSTSSGESQWISGPKARRRAQELRCESDAVLVGVNTVLNDDPRLTCRALKGKRLLRVVLDSNLRVPPGAQLLRGRDAVLVVTTVCPGRKAKLLRERGAEVARVRAGRSGRPRWRDVLVELRRRSIVRLLVEGGAEVASSALEEGVVDRVVVIHAPMLLGPGRSLTAAMRGRRLERAIRLRRVSHEELGDDVVTTGYVPKGRR